MKTFILCGGFGTRLDHEGKLKPKPMVNIGNLPILMHIINYYTKFKITEFVLCLGYKSHVIINYFLKKGFLKIKNKKYIMIEFKIIKKKIKIFLVKTGINTGTAGRIKIAYKKLNLNEDFMMTYGDGLSNVDLDALVATHKNNGRIATVTAVRPPSRFGSLEIENGKVSKFREKLPEEAGWINGGFFYLNKSICDYITDSNEMFERKPIEKIAEAGELTAHQHEGFWQPMDTLRDKMALEEIWQQGSAPWVR